jgi:protein-tyrosine phosphatase
MRVLMVCLGNICRSPLAEGILRAKANKKGWAMEVDSAGTGGWHAGEAPDRRSQKVAAEHGIDISNQKARKFKSQDFDEFDLILAMDTENMKDLLLLAPNEKARNKVKLILNYLNPTKNQNVPDPYYGQMADFEMVFNLLDQALEQFILATPQA